MRRKLATPPSFYAFLLVLVCLVNQPIVAAYEDEMTLAEARAHYIFQLIQQVTWPNEADMSEFKLAVIGNDDDLVRALKEKKNSKIRGKNLVISNPTNIDFALNSYSIIYLDRRKRSQFSKLLARDESVLIITSGRSSHDERMISLRVVDDRMQIKLNRENLSRKGLSASVHLLEMAGTKDDLGEQLRENESQYRALLKEVKEKERTLAELNLTLNNKNKALAKAERELIDKQRALEASQQKLSKLASQEHLAKAKIEESQVELAIQKAAILEKQAEIQNKTASITNLERAIDANQLVLQKQLAELSNQTKTIKSKEETINDQRWLLFISLCTVALFILLLYWLVRSNRLREKSNQQLVELNSKLYVMATTDHLSTLSNRRHFFEMSQKELLRAKRKPTDISVLMIDIDHFKSVNDQYGHNVGDMAIQYVAGRMKDVLRKYDLVGRLGGEEFAMMLIDCSPDSAKEIAQRLCDKISDGQVLNDEEPLTVTVSIGISLLDQQDIHIEQTLNRADKALYQAKKSGRNRVETLLNSDFKESD